MSANNSANTNQSKNMQLNKMIGEVFMTTIMNRYHSNGKILRDERSVYYSIVRLNKLSKIIVTKLNWNNYKTEFNIKTGCIIDYAKLCGVCDREERLENLIYKEFKEMCSYNDFGIWDLSFCTYQINDDVKMITKNYDGLHESIINSHMYRPNYWATEDCMEIFGSECETYQERYDKYMNNDNKSKLGNDLVRFLNTKPTKCNLLYEPGIFGAHEYDSDFHLLKK